MSDEIQTKIPEEHKPTMVDHAVTAASELKAQNDRTEALAKRLEHLQAIQQLGGTSEAGTPPVVPKEETPQEYAKRVIAGEFNVKATPKD